MSQKLSHKNSKIKSCKHHLAESFKLYCVGKVSAEMSVFCPIKMANKMAGN